MKRTFSAGLRCGLALCIGIGLILATYESGVLIQVQRMGLLLFWVPLGVLLALLAHDSERPDAGRIAVCSRWPLLFLAGTLVLALFSEWIRHRWFFFLHWTNPIVPGRFPMYTVVQLFVLLTALLTPMMLLKRKWLTGLLVAALLLAMVGSLARYYGQTNGFELLTRDDHPSFAFRIWKYFETFPRLRSYNPYWNAGEIHSYGPESGVPGPAVFMAPFMVFMPIERLYTALCGLIFIFFVPALAVLSARVMGIGRTGWGVAGILAFATGHYYYLWLMTYGTIGANLAFAFVMPLLACLYRAFIMDRRDWKLGLLLVVSGIFVTLWPPGLLLGGVFGLALLACPKQWTWPKWRFVLICAAVIGLFQLRYYLVLIKAPLLDVLHVQTPSAADSAALDVTALLAEAGCWIRAHFRQVNPLLLFFGIGGSLVLPNRHVRRFFIPVLLGFALITAFGPELVPDLQLDRMIMPMLFAAVLPAAVALNDLLRLRNYGSAILRAAMVSLLLLSCWNIVRIWNNEGIQKYRADGEFYNEFITLLKREMPPGSRLMFAGHSVHAYGGGHVTLFPVLAGREMMASDFYHFNPEHVDYNYPPPPWRDNMDGVDAFIRLYNIALIATIQPPWIERFRAHPERYEEIAAFNDGQIIVFRPNAFPNRLFHRGNGELSAHFNCIDVRLTENQETVIAYNWTAGLQAPAPVELFAHDAGHGVKLIGIRPHGRKQFRIRYR